MKPDTPHRSNPALLWIATALAITITLAGCATGARLSEHWTEPGWSSAPLGKVFVVALRKNAVHRRMWEDAFVARLQQRGVQAIPSYVDFPDAAPDTQQVIDAVRDSAYDGVLVSLRLPNSTESYQVAPTTTKVAEYRRNPFTGFYYTVYRDVYTPGYTETDEVRRYQTDVWATKDNPRLVWSASVRTYDPTSAELVETLIDDKFLPLASKDRIFPPKRDK
ncbi:MAG: hypothetical protein ABI960_01480 [Candidatus Eisenbacteria bacterium]